MNDFQKGTKITICSDAEGKHPRRIGFIKRIGNGAWRVAGTSEWYDFSGKRVAAKGEGQFSEYTNTTCFARLYQEGDEAAIAVEDVRVKKHKDLVDSKAAIERRIRHEQGEIQYATQCAERNISGARERLAEAERRLNYAKNELERALAGRAQTGLINEGRTKTIKEESARLAAVEAELASFGTEW